MQNETAFGKHPLNRRSFLKTGALAGGAAALSAGMITHPLYAGSETGDHEQGHGEYDQLDRGDIAILRFLAAAELIESDLWIQYAELGGVTDGTQNNYQLALQFLDGDGSQYIQSNTLDEISHADFLNAYLQSKGAEPVNFDRFRNLKSSTAMGAKDTGRLTNLMELTVDTSWYVRYRSTTNPDFGATYPQALNITRRPTIPRTDADFEGEDHIQAIADSAAFHFASIEQGGSSLYPALGQKATNAEVLRIIFGIGGSEVAHFLEWVDFAGNAVQGPPFDFNGQNTPVTDAGLTFRDFNNPPNPLLQTNLIFPVPCEFISPKLPKCATIRPLTDRVGGAVAAVNGFVSSGLFIGQSKEFLKTLSVMAIEADSASRRR